MNLANALKILKKWRWTVIGISILAFALVAIAPGSNSGGAAGVGGRSLDRFQSSTKILLTPPSGNMGGFAGGRGFSGMDMQTSWFADPTVLQEVMRSEELLKRVLEQLKGGESGWETLREGVTVLPISQGRMGSVMLFNLSAVSTDPQEAQKIVKLITEEFSNYVQEISAREFASTRRFVEDLVVEAEQQRLQAEENLMMVREKYLNAPSDLEANSQQTGLESQLRDISQKLPPLEAEVSSIRSYLDGNVSTPPWSIVERSDASLSKLETQVTDNRLALEKAREIYTEDNQNVVEAKQRLARSQELHMQGLKEFANSLLDSKNLEFQRFKSQQASVGEQLSSILSSRMSVEDRRLTQKLERELSVWEENHLSLTQQLYQARVVEQSSRRQGSVTVLQQPLSGVPVIEKDGILVKDKEYANRARNRYKQLALAIPFCLAMGAAAALLREYLTSSMKLRPRIEEMLELPVIAVVPSVTTDLSVEWETFKRPSVEKPSFITNGKNGHHGNGYANTGSSSDPDSFRR